MVLGGGEEGQRRDWALYVYIMYVCCHHCEYAHAPSCLEVKIMCHL